MVHPAISIKSSRISTATALIVDQPDEPDLISLHRADVQLVRLVIVLNEQWSIRRAKTDTTLGDWLFAMYIVGRRRAVRAAANHGLG